MTSRPPWFYAQGQAGSFASHSPEATLAAKPSAHFPNWWTDDPDPRSSEGPNQGAKTVSRWREAFLLGFAAHLLRCQSPQPTQLKN